MMTKLRMLRMKLNLTMLLRIMLKESFDITLARVMSMVLMLMLRCKSCLKTIETNKAESKDATEDKVEDFNENVCAYDF